jgi:hypothetical protein
LGIKDEIETFEKRLGKFGGEYPRAARETAGVPIYYYFRYLRLR